MFKGNFKEDSDKKRRNWQRWQRPKSENNRRNKKNETRKKKVKRQVKRHTHIPTQKKRKGRREKRIYKTNLNNFQ